jgi:hypothetical protein
MTTFPVPLFPAVGAAAKPAAFVVAVLIGLALYATYKATPPPAPKQQRP